MRREQIVQGRVDKAVKGLCLLETAFVKDPSKTVDTVIKEAVAQLGEKISIRRFERCGPGSHH